MRCAMWTESLVVSVQARSTRRVSHRYTIERCGVTRMSLPQADPMRQARRPHSRLANHASVPCEVR